MSTMSGPSGVVLGRRPTGRRPRRAIACPADRHRRGASSPYMEVVWRGRIRTINRSSSGCRYG